MNGKDLIGKKVRITDDTMKCYNVGDIGVIIGYYVLWGGYRIDFNNQGNARVVLGGKWAALRKRFELIEDDAPTVKAQSGGFIFNGREYATAEEMAAYFTGLQDAMKAMQ
jgi:hypothetical protein